MRASDTNGGGRRTAYKGYGKSSKVNVNKPKQDGVQTWKVKGINIDVSNCISVTYFNLRMGFFIVILI